MSRYSLSRRELLASGFAVAVTSAAGCLGSGSASDDAENALELTLARKDGSLRDRYVVDLSRSESDVDEEAFEATLADSAYTTQYRTPFGSRPDEPAYTERDGTYYRLGSVVVDEVAESRPVLRLFGTENATDSSDSVAASELPEADQRAVEVAHFAARARGNSGGVPVGLVQRGGYVYRSDSAVESSELLADDGPERVTFRETTYSVDVSDEEFYEPVYRATVEPVADDSEQMEAILRSQFLDARFSRDVLSSDATDVLRAARTDGYSETHPYSTAYREVLRTIDRRAYLDGTIENDANVGANGNRMLRYDDVYYDYRLRFITAVDS